MTDPLQLPFWRYVEPGADSEPVVQVVTEEEIIRVYYPWWCQQMQKVGKAHMISERACIEDWVTVHWAWRD